MGKRLQTKYSDLNQRIIKRPKQVKENIRKRKSNHDPEEPLQKTPKIETKLQELSSETVFVEKLDDCGIFILSTREHLLYDLFFSDELKNNYTNFNSKDIYFHINDEVALEGLDGITIEAFWKRFLTALDGPLHLDTQMQRFIWQNLITSQEQFQFFELPVARPELVIYNLFDYMHTEIGVVMEVAYAPPDIYPIALVNSPSILGSCSNFNERIDISSVVQNLTLEEAENRYGQKLVIVASQNMRAHALYEDTADPCIELLNMEYCILERIGRSRKLGELTQGTMSVTAAFKIDSKTIFHYKKNLCLNNLISTQMFIIKSALLDHNKTGSLIQLKRFYTNIRSRQSCVADQIINVIKHQPNYRIYSKALRSLFPDNVQCVNKLLKNIEFRKFVTPRMLPYRTFYTNATRTEYEIKKTKREKELVFYELVDPYINAMAYWRAQERVDPDEEEDKEEELSGHKMFSVDTIRDVYCFIRSTEDKGCFGKEIKENVGIDRNTARLALNKLLGKSLIDFTKFDDGKQRKYVYKVPHWKRPDDRPITASTPIQKESSIKTKILEKQKAALARKKQENLNKPTGIEPEPSTSTQVDNFLKIKAPDISNYKFIVAQKEQIKQKNPELTLIEIKLNRTYTINLSYILLLNTEQLFNINQMLQEIIPSLNIPQVKEKLDGFLVRKYNLDLETKLSLFKACLGDLKALKELTDFKLENETNEKVSIPNLNQPNNHTKVSETSKLDYMGPSPTVVSIELDQGVTTKIIVSTPPAEIRLEKKYPKSDTLTERVYNRMQTIIDIVNEMRLIEEIYTLNKFIIEKEAETGYSKKIDRKSLLRLLKRLVEDGFIKIFKIIVNNETIYKTIVFVCHPSVTPSDNAIKSACQQLKWKYFFGVVRKMSKPHIPGIKKNIENKFPSSPFSHSDVLNSISEMKQLDTDLLKEIKRKLNKNIGKMYGVKPKFTRMRIIHEFLFFLIYENKKKDDTLPMESVIRLFKNYRIELSETDVEGLPKIYHNEISWKMFVPPLPSHSGWNEGWALVCDIILRLPVSIFLKLHNCTYEDAELLGILNHPIKRYYLVKDLPEKPRKTILFKRKYLFSIYNIIHHLVICGLVQFGPQKYREKDQVFIYLNRNASLLDTRTSGPGYNEIEVKEYPRLSFNFKTLADIDNYWQKLNSISMNTQLNSREPGKLVTLIYLNSKPEIVECVKSRTTESVKLYDTGEIPGDGKGACGLDSSLWCHLVRNWINTKGHKGNSLYTELKQNVLKENAPQHVSFKELRLNSTKVYLPHKKMRRKVSRALKKNKRKLVIKRTIQKRKNQKQKREYNDAVDRKILKKIAGRRIGWNKREEDMVYLAKIADMFLCTDKIYRKQIVPFTIIRDVLHIFSPESRFKTSRSIQRRWIKLQRSGIYHNIEEHLPNLLKILPIKDTFGLLVYKLNTRDENRSFEINDGQRYAAFAILFNYLLRNMDRIIDILHGNFVNIDHLSVQNLEYTENNLIDIENKDKKYQDASNLEQIQKDVLKSVIHSSLCSKEENVNLSMHLLKIYQNHADSVVRTAVSELRETSTITRKKFKNNKLKIWDTPFALSQYYSLLQYSTFNKTSALEAYTTFLDIVYNEGNGIQSNEEGVQKKRYGQLLGINEFYGYCDGISFEFNLPQNTIMLNPKIQDHNELIHELALRYQFKLKALQHDSNDPEIDIEEEDDITDTVNTATGQENEKLVSDSTDRQKPMDFDLQDTQTNPLDLTTDHEDADTIDRLRTWVTDRVKINDERRSPSPEFMLVPIESDEKYEDDQNYSTQCTTEDLVQEKPVPKKSKHREKQFKQIPSLEEIKTGMLELNINNEKRTIPYITELSDLLKENFSELKTNVNVLALKEHFITQYATLDKLIYEDYDYIKDHYMVKFIEDRMKNEQLWDRIESDILVKDFLLLPNFEELMRKENATDEDIQLANEIIQFAASKTFLGASAQELKENFQHREKNHSLINILKHLMKAGILLQTGICSLTFVHYSHQYAWLIQDVICADTDEPHEGQKRYSMKIMPWVRVDGILNKTTLKIWICNVLSHCLDFPKVRFSKICDKYRFIKPVDLFFIVQILEELSCIEMLFYETIEEDMFSEWTMAEEKYATFLDKLDDIIIQPKIFSMTRLGSFFYETNSVDCVDS